MQEIITPENSLPPCPQFAYIGDFDQEKLHDCIVCGRLEVTHDRSGQRGITAEQAKTERLAMMGETVGGFAPEDR